MSKDRLDLDLFVGRSKARVEHAVSSEFCSQEISFSIARVRDIPTVEGAEEAYDEAAPGRNYEVGIG